MAAVTNLSSITMQSRWDWADHTVSGKWGSSQQIYRPRGPFVPDASQGSGPLETGQPIVVTRNKVRGRGRALHLKFTAGEGKDAHILGWTINYTVLTQE